MREGWKVKLVQAILIAINLFFLGLGIYIIFTANQGIPDDTNKADDLHSTSDIKSDNKPNRKDTAGIIVGSILLLIALFGISATISRDYRAIRTYMALMGIMAFIQIALALANHELREEDKNPDEEIRDKIMNSRKRFAKLMYSLAGADIICAILAYSIIIFPEVIITTHIETIPVVHVTRNIIY